MGRYRYRQSYRYNSTTRLIPYIRVYLKSPPPYNFFPPTPSCLQQSSAKKKNTVQLSVYYSDVGTLSSIDRSASGETSAPSIKLKHQPTRLPKSSEANGRSRGIESILTFLYTDITLTWAYLLETYPCLYQACTPGALTITALLIAQKGHFYILLTRRNMS